MPLLHPAPEAFREKHCAFGEKCCRFFRKALHLFSRRAAAFPARRAAPGSGMRAGALVASILVLASCLLPACHNYEKAAEESYALGEYYDASRYYRTAYSKTPPKEREKRARLAYMIGQTNRFISSAARAEAGYRNALRYGYPDSTLLLWLAQVQLEQGKYREAGENFSLYLQSVPDNPLTPLAQAGLLSAQTADSRKQETPRFAVKKYDLFNSRRAEYCPSYNRTDSDRVYFTSTRDDARGETLNGITGMKSADIFMARRNENKQWQKPEIIESDINSEYEDGACSFTPDGETMFFTRCRESPTSPVFAEIFSSARSGANWGAGQKCEIINDTLSSVAHPAVSPDGVWLYFTSDMPGGMGGKDIWRCMILGDGSFGPVENLGSSLNTEGDEMFPYVRDDGALYFASDGWPGMGGLDLFRAEEDSLSGEWRVEHLGYPLNSSADDFGITFEPERNRGFFSSNRRDRRGWDHIYEFIGDELDYTLVGWVYDRDGDPLPGAVVSIVGDDGTYLKVSVNGDGYFSQKVGRGVSYALMANCRGYLNSRQELLTDTVEEKLTYELEFPMASITRPVLIENIFYEFDKATLTPESSAALDQLIKLLQDNPNVTIELGAHCDYFGNDDYNLRLSQRRAESVVRYLEAGGIAPDRLSAKGYGETQPKVITKSLARLVPFLQVGDTLTEDFILKLPPEEQDVCNSLNRRTEFRVLRTTYGLYE